jgi:hypothetical protein
MSEHPLFKVKYRHLGWYKQSNGEHSGVVTVSVQKRLDDMVVGFSFCAPNDTFCRKQGRIEADKHRRSEPIIIDGHDTAGIIEALSQINRMGGFIYDYKPHAVTGRALNWLDGWLDEHFPFICCLSHEFRKCKIT